MTTVPLARARLPELRAAPPPLRRSLSFVAVLVVLGMLAAHLGAGLFVVSGDSMSPAAPKGAILVVNRIAQPARGDLVVFRDPGGWLAEDEPGGLVVKRVIALEGDRLSCCEPATGRLVRNGEPVDEPFLAGGAAASRIGFDVVVPEGAVWLLGDNREVSRDSRAHLAEPGRGALPTADIEGVVWQILGR